MVSEHGLDPKSAHLGSQEAGLELWKQGPAQQPQLPLLKPGTLWAHSWSSSHTPQLCGRLKAVPISVFRNLGSIVLGQDPRSQLYQ